MLIFYLQYLILAYSSFIFILCVPFNKCFTMGFPGGSVSKEFTCNVGDLSLILELGRYPGEAYGYPLQYSGLENFMDRPWVWKELDTTEQLSTHALSMDQVWDLPDILFHQSILDITILLHCFLVSRVAIEKSQIILIWSFYVTLIFSLEAS